MLEFLAAEATAIEFGSGWWITGTDAVGWVGPESRPPSKSKLKPPSASSMEYVCISMKICVYTCVCVKLGFFGEEEEEEKRV